MRELNEKFLQARILFSMIMIVLVCLQGLPLAALQTQAYRVTVQFQLQNNGCPINKLAVLIPLPRSNMYQEIINLSLGNGELLRVTNGTDIYARYLLTSNFPRSGTTSTLATIEYDVILKEINRPVAGSVPNTAYNRNDPDYSKYTAANLPFIDPAEGRIVNIANTLWQEAGQIPLAYARKAYEYVATHYRYLNPNTGLYPLTEILDNGGGDCGNLSSIFISLLRAKGIPARHLVAKSVDNNGHAWAEFLLENFGWVPVDVTYKLSDRSGNYFGRHAYQDKYVVVSTDLNLGVELDQGRPYTAGLLQNFVWQVWTSGQRNRLVPSLSITSQPSTVDPYPGIAKIGTLKVTRQDAAAQALAEMGEIYVYSMLDQKVVFACGLFQDNVLIPGTKTQVDTEPLNWDPAYWGEQAYTFTYDLDTIRQQADNSKPVEVVVSIVDPAGNKVLGSKKETLSLANRSLPDLKKNKNKLEKVNGIKQLDPKQLIFLENQNPLRKVLTEGSYALRAKANGKFVCVVTTQSNPLNANRDGIEGTGEKFELVSLGGDKWALKAQVNNKFVGIGSLGNAPLFANRSAASSAAERFIITDCGDGYFSLKAEGNVKFVSVGSTGVNPLLANSTTVGDTEKFIFLKQ